MLNQDEENGSRPGRHVQTALLLSSETELESSQSDIIFAATVILTQDSKGLICVSALSSCEAEGKKFPLDQDQLNTLVTLLHEDLATARTIRSLAGVLTSQEEPK